MVKSALIQFTMELEKQRNIEKAKGMVREAAAKGARIVCLPELFNTIYFCYERETKYFDWAEPIPGPTTQEMAQVAQEEGIVLIAPIYERVGKGELYNTAAILGPRGELMGKYSKSHIPHVASGPPGSGEKFYFTPGRTGFPVFETPFGITIGVIICYDRHFPEAFRAQALQGADVIYVPSGAPATAKPMWEVELQAMARMNLCYVGGLNRVGDDIGGNPEAGFFGRSLFVDPRGDIMCQASEEEEAILCADLDAGLVEERRNFWGHYRDRRPELYQILAR